MSENPDNAEPKEDAGSTETEETAQAPMNRAERRAAAKHKASGAAHQQFGHGVGGLGGNRQAGRPAGGAGQVKMPRRTGGA